jgi:hypothetical protein
MPKKVSRDKRGRRPLRTAAGAVSRRAHSVKELLGTAAPALTAVTAGAVRAAFWKNWLCHHLPTELSGQISGLIEREGALIIFAASAAWCARLRYSIGELGAEMRAAAPGLKAIRVRVQPRGSAPPP